MHTVSHTSSTPLLKLGILVAPRTSSLVKKKPRFHLKGLITLEGITAQWWLVLYSIALLPSTARSHAKCRRAATSIEPGKQTTLGFWEKVSPEEWFMLTAWTLLRTLKEKWEAPQKKPVSSKCTFPDGISRLQQELKWYPRIKSMWSGENSSFVSCQVAHP